MENRKKKPLVFTLILLLCAACLAEGGDLRSLVQAKGFSPTAALNEDGVMRCDYTLTGEGIAVMAWSNETRLYTVSGDADALSTLYLDALDRAGWESCRYIAGDEALLSYGMVSAQRCESLEEYASQVRAALGLQSFAAAFAGITSSYVLNRRSKKFHFPECPAVDSMSPKNREDFTGNRDALIAMGYSPCGICKP